MPSLCNRTSLQEHGKKITILPLEQTDVPENDISPYGQIKMPSKEVRVVKKECMATVGEVGAKDRRLIRWGKAGRMRHRGWRPTVRGKAMNPVDHPHGGGEGLSPIGLKYPKTKWGKHALGVKTRKANKWSNKFIIKRRK